MERDEEGHCIICFQVFGVLVDQGQASSTNWFTPTFVSAQMEMGADYYRFYHWSTTYLEES